MSVHSRVMMESEGPSRWLVVSALDIERETSRERESYVDLFRFRGLVFTGGFFRVFAVLLVPHAVDREMERERGERVRDTPTQSEGARFPMGGYGGRHTGIERVRFGMGERERAQNGLDRL